MFITKLDRSKAKMKKEFQSLKLDPKDFGNLITVEKMEEAFDEYAKQERKRLANLNNELNIEDNFHGGEETLAQSGRGRIAPLNVLGSPSSPRNNNLSANPRPPSGSSTMIPAITHDPTPAAGLLQASTFLGRSGQSRKNSWAHNSQNQQNILSSFASGMNMHAGRQLAMELGSSPELMKEFGIEHALLRKAASTTGNYKHALKQIMEAMKEKIRKDMQDLFTKRDNRANEEGYQELMRAYSQMKSRSEMSKRDIFAWMKVPTKSQLLKKKLRTKIVENIGDGENYAKIKKALDEIKDEAEENKDGGALRESKRESLSNLSLSHGKSMGFVGSLSGNKLAGDGIYQKNTKLFLDNISFDNTQILDEFSKFMKSTKLMTRKSSMGSSSQKKSLSTSMASSVPPGSATGSKRDSLPGDSPFNRNPNPKDTLKKVLSHAGSNASTPNLHQESSLSKEVIITNKVDRLNYQPATNEVVNNMNISKYLREEDKWDAEKEREFVNRRQKSRFQMTYLCNSSSWNDVAFGKLVNEIRYNDSNKNYRNNLISKYMGGEWLTEAEIRYIAVTSECLNEFVDRDYFNKAIEILDDEVFDNIEMNLAENIIKEYKVIRKLVYDSRNEFLKNITKRKHKKTKEHSLLQEIAHKPSSERQKKLNRSAHEKTTKLFKAFLHEKEESEKKRQEEEARRREGRGYYFRNNTKSGDMTVQSPFEDNNQRKLPDDKKVRKEWAEFLERNFQPMIQTHLFGRISKKDYKHTNHPSSKIILGKNHTGNMQSPREGTNKLEKKVKIYDEKEVKEMEFYRLKMDEKNREKQEKFKQTYTMGPRELKSKPKTSMVSQMKAAFVIQNAFRRVLALKKARLQKIKKEELKVWKEKEQASKPVQHSRSLSSGKYQRSMTIKSPKMQSFIQTAGESKTNINTPVNNPNTQNLKGFGPLPSQSHEEKRVTFIKTQKEESETIGVPVAIKKRQVDANTLLKNRQLMEAVKENHTNRVKSLSFIYSEDDINVADVNGYTPLYYAAQNGNLDICKWLLERKAKINQVCTQGFTPMHAAFKSQNPFVKHFIFCKPKFRRKSLFYVLKFHFLFFYRS